MHKSPKALIRVWIYNIARTTKNKLHNHIAPVCFSQLTLPYNTNRSWPPCGVFPNLRFCTLFLFHFFPCSSVSVDYSGHTLPSGGKQSRQPYHFSRTPSPSSLHPAPSSYPFLIWRRQCDSHEGVGRDVRIISKAEGIVDLPQG